MTFLSKTDYREAKVVYKFEGVDYKCEGVEAEGLVVFLLTHPSPPHWQRYVVDRKVEGLHSAVGTLVSNGKDWVYPYKDGVSWLVAKNGVPIPQSFSQCPVVQFEGDGTIRVSWAIKECPGVIRPTAV